MSASHPTGEYTGKLEMQIPGTALGSNPGLLRRNSVKVLTLFSIASVSKSKLVVLRHL